MAYKINVTEHANELLDNLVYHLIYCLMEKESVDTSFYLDSDIKKIDDRNIILNFYSEAKKQYIDIELPKDIYNFLQTYFPEKKYSIVNELEKKLH